MKKLILFPIMFYIFNVSGFALEYQENVINVSGYATTKIPTDVAKFDVYLQSESLRKDSSAIKLERIDSTFKKIIESYKNDSISVVLKNLSIIPNVKVSKGERVCKGYVSKKKYEITLYKLNALSQILFDLYSKSNADFGSIEFESSIKSKVEKDILKLAIQDAKLKADEVANASGVKIKEPSIISTQRPSDFSYETRVDIDFNKTDSDLNGSILAGASGEIERNSRNLFDIKPIDIEISSEVWITYKIIQK